MNFKLSKFRFLSSDEKHRLYCEIYEPLSGEFRGVVQLAHGMTDHVGRYEALAEFLTGKGFVFAGHCHLGHGRSVENKEELGFFAERGGADFVIEDMHLMNEELRRRFPNLPVVVMGHSMGSFIARLFAVKYPSELSGLIIHGTGGPSGIVSAGKVLVKCMSVFCGKRHRSKLIRSLASRGYNSKFPKGEGKNAWLTRDAELAAAKLEDPLANFTFTLSAYNDLFTFVKRSNSKKWFDEYPKTLPTLIVSGDMDPVGGFGRGVLAVRDGLLSRGHTALTYKIYEGARHELFNETNKEEIFSDIAAWLDEVTA